MIDQPLHSYIVEFPEAFPDAVCSQIIIDMEAAPLTHQNVPGHRSFFSCKLTDLNPQFAQQFYQTIMGRLKVYADAVKLGPADWPSNVGFEAFQVKKYVKGEGHFNRHVDVMDHGSAKRFLAFILYLNDVEEGGETVFFDHLGAPAYAIKPKRGKLAIFPPLWMFPHAGATPKSDDKFTVQGYMHYQDAPKAPERPKIII